MTLRLLSGDRIVPTRSQAVVLTIGLSLAAMTAPMANNVLDEKTATSGLKEALGQGASRAVETLGQVGGYLENPDVRIPVPENLGSVAKTMRSLGLGGVVDDLETSMNRAAEAAAPLARDVFIETIKQMTITEALDIVRGQQHEATDYLATHSRPRLSELFTPIVSEQLESVGATRAFGEFTKSTRSLPFVGKSTFDLDEYVTGKALDGLFLMIAREEEKIRTDPLARTSDLLKKVFGDAESEEKRPWWKRLTSREPQLPAAVADA